MVGVIVTVKACKYYGEYAKNTNPLMERVRPEMVIRFDRDLLSSFYIYKGVLK